MGLRAKICGLTTAGAVDAAVAGGADFVGFVFYPPSPRALTPAAAAALADGVPETVSRVGVFVDPDNDTLEETLDSVELDLIQLHGGETPERVAEVARRTGLAVIKAIAVASEGDVARAWDYEDVAAYLLFDAKPPKDMSDALPGGNGIAFDQALVRGGEWRLPWFLSGGLNADNLAAAVAASGARLVDVSSGVESAPGLKDVNKIREFLAVSRTLDCGDAA